ncbi:MAG: RtcB family protein [Gemmatimonadota bacterium]|nr:MAG: RtcB family protein [Gemmatimonadota bacterium]
MAVEGYRLEKIDDYRWRVPRTGPMLTDGLVFADEDLIPHIEGDKSLQQVANVACLPGIQGPSIAMPDIHWGYGFPIGGVAAFDLDTGVISPGGVGYDINCGVRLLRSDIHQKELRPRLSRLMDRLYQNVPSGVGASRPDLKLSAKEVKRVLLSGAGWAVENGYGWAQDLDRIEANGRIEGADPDNISERALERGRAQVGTLGSGNHFIEIGYVGEVYDEVAAAALGLQVGTVTAFIHSGSRGLGYQVCDDYLKTMLRASEKYGIVLQDRQLCSAPLGSDEARRYLSAMRGAANYAFCNRQMMADRVRATFSEVLRQSAERLGLRLVYDVAHNIAKIETHRVNGREKKVCVHRKGATRAFPPGHPEVPEAYRQVGQPIFIPGDMGRYSYVLVGTEGAYNETFGSTCHGAGRMMSRKQAKRTAKGRAIVRELEDMGILIRAASRATVDEEISEAYKDVKNVVEVVHRAGIGKMVAQLKPLGVLKG